jgi:hypothetical protein
MIAVVFLEVASKLTDLIRFLPNKLMNAHAQKTKILYIYVCVCVCTCTCICTCICINWMLARVSNVRESDEE